MTIKRKLSQDYNVPILVKPQILLQQIICLLCRFYLYRPPKIPDKIKAFRHV